MDIDVIGDEVHGDGQLIALLVSRGGASLVAEDFAFELRNGTLFETLDVNECECNHKKECPMYRAEVGTQRSELEEDDRSPLLTMLAKRARGGLLTLEEACEVVNLYMDGEIGA